MYYYLLVVLLLLSFIQNTIVLGVFHTSGHALCTFSGHKNSSFPMFIGPKKASNWSVHHMTIVVSQSISLAAALILLMILLTRSTSVTQDTLNWVQK